MDVETGRVIASRRLDESLQSMGDAAPVYLYREDRRGYPSVWVLSLRLEDQ